MRHSEIFHEIVEIMQQDYAGCYDKKGWDRPEVYSEKIELLEQQGALTPHMFEEIVEDYLLDFQDPHMIFKIKERNDVRRVDVGFKVRRFEDKLYVVSTGREERLERGDAIISLDGVRVLDLVNHHQRELIEKEPERERWEDIIKQYSTCEVGKRNGDQLEMRLRLYEKEAYQPLHTIEKLDDYTLLITLTDFIDAEVFSNLLKQYRSQLDETPNWMIDVRFNLGGSTQTFQEFLTYLFPNESFDLSKMLDYRMEFHCTERNCQLQKKRTDQSINETNDEEMRNWLLQYQQGWLDHWGEGFVDFEAEMPANYWLHGKRNPKHIVLLSDVKCGSAGDIFVELAQQSSKVTVVGRPTANINTYSNLINKEWGDAYEFMYPTSKIVSDHEVKGGQPDIYIPWTPEHLERDVDFEEGMRVFKRKSMTK